MKQVRWMVGAGVGSWLIATAALGMRTGAEVLLGMIGPLAVASGTWVMAERTYKRRPERLTSLMTAAFAGKMMFFGAYVTVVLTVLSPRSIPFVVSFMSYFIALHLLEALCLRRLFADGMGARR
jgi:hypothetical protein